MTEKTKETMKWGIFLRMSAAKETLDVINVYEKAVPKIIRKWKDNYNMKEYAGVMERSKEGFIHVHIYINQYLPLKEINKQWCELIGIEDITKGNLYMIKVENEEHKKNILDYIWKAPLRTWICQTYKDKYGWKTGNPVKNNILELQQLNNEIIYEDKVLACNFEENVHENDKKIRKYIRKSVTKNKKVESAENEKSAKKKGLKIGDLKNYKFICAEHRRSNYKIYKKQIDLEYDLIYLKSIEILKKKGGKNYKMNLNVLRKLGEDIKPYIYYDSIAKNLKEKTKEIMLLNMVYIALQLENIKESHYIYYKIGSKLLKYYDINKHFILLMIENNKQYIKNVKKITKTEWKLLYSWFYNSAYYDEYKKKVIEIGVKFFTIFKTVFFKINNETKRLILKDKYIDIVNKIISNLKIKKYKYKLPFIEKPKEWGPDLQDLGGWHMLELRHPLVKQDFNNGNQLIINYKKIYPIINRLQNIEYEINKEFLNFVLEHKDKIYEFLLKDFKKDSQAYKTIKEQYDITLNLAVYMSNYKKFYFTFEFDYRGRLYPHSEYLNYQGNLLARSLIRWHNSKKKDMKWLEIACVSLYKGMLGYSYEDMVLLYQQLFKNLKFENWYDYFKNAKEPILWLTLFYELKNNLKEETKYIIWFDATCSGSQLISLLVNDESYFKELNLSWENKVYDYYTVIYEKYGNIKGIADDHVRKIIKKTVMTINYGLTRIGCHKKIYPLLKEYEYCKNWKEYKIKWYNEIEKFYKFLQNLNLVKHLNILQEIWDEFCAQLITYEFVIGETGFIVNNDNNIINDLNEKYHYLFKMKTFVYKKYYKNLSLYNKSRKMKEKGFKYLWHNKILNKREQKRKIKANLIHMLDATWNILICKNVNFDIASIHDCHGIHSINVDIYFKEIKQVLEYLFFNTNQYYNLLLNMLLQYNKQINDEVFFKEILEKISKYKTNIIFDTIKWWYIKKSKYIFIPK